MISSNEKAYVIRKRRNYSYSDMAMALGIKPQRYGLYERGELINKEADKVADILYTIDIGAYPLTLKEKLMVMRLRHGESLFAVCTPDVFWNFVSGQGFKKHSVYFNLIASMSKGLINPEECNGKKL